MLYVRRCFGRLTVTFQAALEAPRVLNLTSNKYFSGPYGIYHVHN